MIYKRLSVLCSCRSYFFCSFPTFNLFSLFRVSHTNDRHIKTIIRPDAEKNTSFHYDAKFTERSVPSSRDEVSISTKRICKSIRITGRRIDRLSLYGSHVGAVRTTCYYRYHDISTRTFDGLGFRKLFSKTKKL